MTDENINEPKIVQNFMNNLFDEKLNESQKAKEENIDNAAEEITNFKQR